MSLYSSCDYSHALIPSLLLTALPARLAGSDTTATIIRTGFLSIISNPQIYRKLQSECISTVSCSGSIGELSFLFDHRSLEDTCLPKCFAGSENESQALIKNVAGEIVESFCSGHVKRGILSHPSHQSTSTTSSSQSELNLENRSYCSSNPYSAGSTGLKRSRREEEEQGPWKRPRIGKGTENSTTVLGRRLFAYPYHKFDKIRYSERNRDEKHYRRCSSSYLLDMNRVKQHLYRVHRRPKHYCQSCFTEFPNEEQQGIHSRERPSCDLVECPFDERMTNDQFVAIKRREMGQHVERAWFNIYSILFPEGDQPSSPYVDSSGESDDIDSFLDYFESNAPPMITVRLYLPTAPEEVQAWTQEILQECIVELTQRYRQQLAGTDNGDELGI